MRIATLDAERLGLAPGRPWGPTQQRILRELQAAERARIFVLRLLAAAPRARAAIDRRLRSHGVSPRLRAAVLDDLERDGWIDDRRLAADRLDRLLADGPWGRTALQRRLVGGGVPQRVAIEALRRRSAQIDDVAGDRAWVDRARRARSDAAVRAVLRRRGLDAVRIADAMAARSPQSTPAASRRTAARR